MKHPLELLLLEQLGSKIDFYGVEPEHTYNMDEIGFMVGAVGRQKRIFSKRSFKVHLLLITRVGSMAIAIHGDARLRCELILVSVEEASNSAFRNKVSSNIRRVILHHFSFRR
jgi:hypothetical protein